MPAVAAKATRARAVLREPSRPRSRGTNVTRKPALSEGATPALKRAKAKLVRDSFTMPSDDHNLISLLKARAAGFERPAKKSELLRAGLQALHRLNDSRLRAALEALVPLKPGRPKKLEPT
jgi:hypothetical protein